VIVAVMMMPRIHSIHRCRDRLGLNGEACLAAADVETIGDTDAAAVRLYLARTRCPGLLPTGDAVGVLVSVANVIKLRYRQRGCKPGLAPWCNIDAASLLSMMRLGFFGVDPDIVIVAVIESPFMTLNVLQRQWTVQPHCGK